MSLGFSVGANGDNARVGFLLEIPLGLVENQEKTQCSLPMLLYQLILSQMYQIINNTFNTFINNYKKN